jgi:monoamine oxidase
MSRSLYARLHRRFGTRLSGEERHQKIARRMAAASDEALSSLDSSAPRAVRVIVVGGGFAGLMAARTLAPSREVTLFEARDRLGGRVHSLQDFNSKRIVEAGAELIGYAHPTWLALAQHFGLSLVVWSSDSDFDALKLETPTYLNGTLLTRAQNHAVYDEMNTVFAQMSETAKKFINDPYEPWTDPTLAEYDAKPLSDWLDSRGCSTLTRAALEVQFSNTNGAPTRRQSLLANLALVAGAARHGDEGDFFTMSENARCASGNEALAQALANEIKSFKGEVHLSSPVEKIQILKDGVSVTCRGGQSIDADFVVLAIPPSLWNTGGIELVEPSIPSDCYMTMGSAVKHLSTAASRFWASSGLAPSASSDECGMTWEGTDNQTQLAGQPVELSLFAGGDAATRGVQAFASSGQAGARSFYDAAIGNVYSTYARHRLNTQFVCWPHEPWTLTGYSCPAPGDVFRVSSHLSKPHEDRLYFAGEHTCLPFFGYMEGALQSGAHVARAILRR